MRRFLLAAITLSPMLGCVILSCSRDDGASSPPDAGRSDREVADGSDDAPIDTPDAFVCVPRDGGFCDDFEEEPPFARWSWVDRDAGGDVTRVSDASVGSRPRAARLALPAADGGPAATLVRSLPWGLTHVRCAWTMRIELDPLPSQSVWLSYRIVGASGDAELGMELVYTQTAASEPTQLAQTWWYERGDAGPISGGYPAGSFEGLRDGEPHRFEVEIAPSAVASGYVSARVDDAQTLTKIPMVEPGDYSAELVLGPVTRVPSGGTTLLVDDVECVTIP